MDSNINESLVLAGIKSYIEKDNPMTTLLKEEMVEKIKKQAALENKEQKLFHKLDEIYQRVTRDLKIMECFKSILDDTNRSILFEQMVVDKNISLFDIVNSYYTDGIVSESVLDICKDIIPNIKETAVAESYFIFEKINSFENILNKIITISNKYKNIEELVPGDKIDLLENNSVVVYSNGKEFVSNFNKMDIEILKRFGIII